MGSAQTTILAAGQPAAFAGMCTQKLDSNSAASRETSLNIQFGLGVKPGVKVKEMLLPTASSSILLGILLQNQVYAPGTFGEIDQTGTTKGIIPNTMGEVLTEGRAWVIVDGDASITPNVTRAYWRFETDGASNTLVGTFRHTDDGHVADVRGQVLFVSGVFTAADGVTKIAEVVVSRSNKGS
jgi:hypothetical protein